MTARARISLSSFMSAIAAAIVSLSAPRAFAQDQPIGDFQHHPPERQQPDAPVPLYFVYSGEQHIEKVTVKFKGAGMDEWQAVDLKKLGKGWGGYVPCAAVTEGILKYWVVGFDPNGRAVAMGGATRRPYQVPIHAGQAGTSHLPGRAAPHRCSENDSGEPPEPAQGQEETEPSDETASPTVGGSTGKANYPL